MKTGRPQCVCSPDCSHITRKHAVCGSDGKTYQDECTMLLARCMGHPDLEVMYQGECKSKPDCPIFPPEATWRHSHSLMISLSSCLAQSHAPMWCVRELTPAWLTRPTVPTASCAAQHLAQYPCCLSSQSVAMTTSLTPAPATFAGPPASWAAP